MSLIIEVCKALILVAGATILLAIAVICMYAVLVGIQASIKDIRDKYKKGNK